MLFPHHPVVTTVAHTTTHVPIAPAPLNIRRTRWRGGGTTTSGHTRPPSMPKQKITSSASRSRCSIPSCPCPRSPSAASVRSRRISLGVPGRAGEHKPAAPDCVGCPVRPSTLVITARPCPFSNPTLTKKQMNRPAPLDYNEALRLYVQVSTNPPYVALFSSPPGLRDWNRFHQMHGRTDHVTQKAQRHIEIDYTFSLSNACRPSNRVDNQDPSDFPMGQRSCVAIHVRPF